MTMFSTIEHMQDSFNSRDICLRKEYFGLLVWNRLHDCYYSVNDKNIAKIIPIVVADTGDMKLLNAYPGLESELAALGIAKGIRQVHREKQERLSAPLDIYLDFTWRCNLHCRNCYNRDRPPISMNTKQIEYLLNEFQSIGVMRVHLAGGEPFLELTNLKTYLKTTKQLGIGASVNSNGTIFSEKIGQTLFENDLVSITFSLDGPDASSHDVLRNRGAYARSVDTIAKTTRLKKEAQSKTRIQVKSIWTQDTPITYFEELILQAIRLNVDVMQFHNPERCIFHKKGYYSINPKGYYDRLSLISELKEKYRDLIRIWNVWNPVNGCEQIGLNDMNGCIGGQELIAINPDGSISPCLMNQYRLGNLFKDWGGSFSAFWDSPELSNFQKKAKIKNEYCNDCQTYSSCRGGCKTRIIVERNELAERGAITLEMMNKGIDPLCPRKNKITIIPKKDVPFLKYFTPIRMAHSL